MKPATTTPVSCERPPLLAAAKLRESLPFAGQPWNSPATRLAAPSAMNSLFALTSSRSRIASPRAGEDAAREDEQRDAQRGHQQIVDIGEGGARKARQGQTGGDISDDRDLVREPGRRNDHRGENQRRETGWHLRQKPAEQQKQRGGAEADPDRPPVHRVGVPHEAAQHRRARPRRLDPGRLGELADHDHDSRAGEVAHQHRRREQARDHSEASDESEQEEAGNQQRQHPGQRRIALGVAARERPELDGDDHRDRGLRPGVQVTARAEDGVRERARDRDVEPGDRRQSRQLPVREALRDHERPERQPGDHVASEPGAVVRPDQRHAWKKRAIIGDRRSAGGSPRVDACACGRHGSTRPSLDASSIASLRVETPSLRYTEIACVLIVFRERESPSPISRNER